MLRTAQLLEMHRQDAGGDFAEGSRRTREDVKTFLRSGKIEAKDLSIREMFDTFVVAKHPHLAGDLRNAQPEALAEAMTASDFPYATSELIHSVVIPAYNYEMESAMSLVTEVTSNNEIEDIVGFGSVDRLEVVLPNQPYPETRIDEKRVRIQNYKLGHKLPLTREAVVFDKTGELVSRASRIGVKAGQQMHEYILTRCMDIASTLTGQAANTSLNINGTARAMYADTHAAWDTVANDNVSASSALGTSGLESATALLMQMQDKKGDYVSVNPNTILVGPSNWAVATRLMVDTTQPDTANRAGNIFQGRYNVIVTPFISAATDWYIGDFASQMRLQRVWGPEITVIGNSSQLAFDRDVVSQYKFSDFVGVGATDYRFAVKCTA